MKHLIHLITAACLIASINSYAQSDSIFYPQGHYLDISAGLSTGLMRDYGTSPLFYTGFMGDIVITDQYFFGKNRLDIRVQSNNGAFIKLTENQSYSASASFIDAEISYYRFFGVIEGTNILQAGGFSLSNFTTIRQNPSLGNGGFSFDNISSLQAKFSFGKKLTWKAKDGKFLWLIKYHRKEKHYFANLDFGVPLYSIIYRQGYTNPGNSTLDYINPFEGYESFGKFFSGINSKLSLNRVYDNGNMYGISYDWNLLTTGKKDINQLNLSHHAIMFHLVFKFK